MHLAQLNVAPTAFTFRHRFEPGGGAQVGTDRDACPA